MSRSLVRELRNTTEEIRTWLWNLGPGTLPFQPGAPRAEARGSTPSGAREPCTTLNCLSLRLIEEGPDEATGDTWV
eukprot:2937089-Alexandrium_andersonii.AAC.1